MRVRKVAGGCVPVRFDWLATPLVRTALKLAKCQEYVHLTNESLNELGDGYEPQRPNPR